MSFIREWLPITRSNRVALGLAALALVIFVVWNCLPHYDYAATEPDGIVATSMWPGVFSPDIYLIIFKDPNIEGFISIAAHMALIQNALVTLAAVPFWKHLHASSYVRLPLAAVNLLGGTIILRHLYKAVIHDFPGSLITLLTLLALGMLVLSAALFTFRNELALRSERAFSGKGGEP